MVDGRKEKRRAKSEEDKQEKREVETLTKRNKQKEKASDGHPESRKKRWLVEVNLNV